MTHFAVNPFLYSFDPDITYMKLYIRFSYLRDIGILAVDFVQIR